jgi:hypothetical protein
MRQVWTLVVLFYLRGMLKDKVNSNNHRTEKDMGKKKKKFNVSHVRALCYTKTLITNKCTKGVLSSVLTHSYMFRPCWVIFRENSFVVVTPRLHFTVRGPARTAEGSCLQKQRSTQLAAHSHSTIKCNLGATITKKFSLNMTQQGRNM